MKKSMCLLVVFCLIFTQGILFVQAQDTIINGLDVIPGGQGIGFYDNGLFGGDGSLEILFNGALLRGGGEWSKYDLSQLGLASGTYSLKISYNSNIYSADFRVYLNVLIDDALSAKRELLPTSTSSWVNEFDEADLGYVHISDATQTIAFKNSGIWPLIIKDIKLSLVSEENICDNFISFYAQNITNHVNLADDKVEYISGEDYYDEGGKLFTSSEVSQNQNVVAHGKDWFRYDVSDLKPGTYNIKTYLASKKDVKLKISADNIVNINNVSIPATGEYHIFSETGLGTVCITDGASTVKIENVGNNAYYLKYFKLEFVEDLNKDSVLCKEHIEANNVILLDGVVTHGYSFYDAGGENKLEMGSGIYVILRNKDWVRYDISGLPSGTYDVKALIGNTSDSAISLNVDDDIQLDSVLIPATSLYTSPVEVELGRIDIQEEQTIKFTCNSSKAMFFYSFVLEKRALILETNYASDALGNIIINNLADVTGATGEGTLYIAANIINNGLEENFEFTTIVAAYDGDTLISCDVYPQTLSEGNKLIQSYPVEVSARYNVKTLIWNNLDNLKAYKDVKEIH